MKNREGVRTKGPIENVGVLPRMVFHYPRAGLLTICRLMPCTVLWEQAIINIPNRHRPFFSKTCRFWSLSGEQLRFSRRTPLLSGFSNQVLLSQGVTKLRTFLCDHKQDWCVADKNNFQILSLTIYIYYCTAVICPYPACCVIADERQEAKRVEVCEQTYTNTL